jgi:hypothetical protein
MKNLLEREAATRLGVSDEVRIQNTKAVAMTRLSRTTAGFGSNIRIDSRRIHAVAEMYALSLAGRHATVPAPEVLGRQRAAGWIASTLAETEWLTWI